MKLCFWLEQRSGMKLLVAEKCKPCEINWRIYNVCREICFSKKDFTNSQNMGLPLCIWVKITIQGVETDWLTGKEKVSSLEVSKEGHADSLPGQDRTGSITVDFLEKKVQLQIVLSTVNSFGNISLNLFLWFGFFV